MGRDRVAWRVEGGGVKTVTIGKLKEQAGEQVMEAVVMVEVQSRVMKQTRTGKPYLVVTLADATGSFGLNVWSDAAFYDALEGMEDGTVLSLSGEWTQNSYGLGGGGWRWERLEGAALEAFYAGDAETAAKQAADWEWVVGWIGRVEEPRLRAVAERFLREYGARFRRAAAARRNHHARRGGLVEHVAQMMRSAVAVAGVYPELNRDLLLVGVLFHDCGKLWENPYGERGFGQGMTLHGEMLGHIPLGIELVNRLWRDEIDGKWEGVEPASETVRLHLLHLVASHHGEYQFGSPTLPRTPEAMALHYIDNLDARLEMMKDAYAKAPELAEGIYEKQFPLPANLVEPLPRWREAGSGEASTGEVADLDGGVGSAEGLEEEGPGMVQDRWF